ncbi:TetR/AcrR family transcriptional regulator [Solihabitans fulvus]|uniref:TetR/AcrR family transcriptional regulator n=1 Tax=Solihabitans fulvus TaxID=1892852 RepID=UPI001CB75DF4|nr:TetR/AcrR family transcriptional regulator [Solihabitans fulvus]
MNAPARRRRARPGDGDLLREDILRVAEQLLLETGDDTTLTLRAVAARAHVTTPSVYLHFTDKQALVGAVCLRVWEGLGARMREATADVTDPYHALRRTGTAYILFGLDHPVQYRLLMMRPPTPGDTRSEKAAADACFHYLVDAVRPCVDAGILEGDPAQLALQMWSAVHGCVTLQISQPDFPWPTDREALAEDVARMAGLGTGLLSRVRTAPPTVTGVDYATQFTATRTALNPVPEAGHVPQQEGQPGYERNGQ